ncbi:DegV family protein [Erysipelotrichaceae bacterium RD49]|nr:DegV family protein [Erysipelotrichaceae bacterium RD49]
MIWIVTDSAQELKNDQDKGLVVVKLPVLVNGETPKEEISDEQFYMLLDSDGVNLTTSQFSPAGFEELFAELLKNPEDEVVAVLLSSGLSGTFNSARLAAMEYEGRVHLVDSRNACLSQTALVKEALRLRDQGLTAAQLAKAIEKAREDVKLFAIVPTLKYLKKGGRISAAKAAIGELAGIKPIVTIDENGEVGVAAQVRGLKKAVRQVAALANKEGVDLERPIVLGFSGLDRETVTSLTAELENVLGVSLANEEPYSLSQVLGVHVGPGAAGIGFFTKK